MKIKAKMWKNYIEKMAEIDKKAAKRMEDWIDKHGVDDRKALIDYANYLILHYGEASGSLACTMYDAIAKAQEVMIPPAEIAKIPKYGEVAKAINGALKQSENMVPSAVARMTKQIGADTMLYNAERDHAQFKWISSGDSCKFCNMLASRDWQYVSKDTLKNGHAEHIHANCKCQYAIRFDESSKVESLVVKDENTQEQDNPFLYPNTSLKVNENQQRNHIVGTKEYKQRAEAAKKKGQHGPSYVELSIEEIQELVDKYHGKGIIKIRRDGGQPSSEVIITNDKIVGTVVDNRNGNSAKTSVFKIHYGNKGTHIVPDYPSKKGTNNGLS